MRPEKAPRISEEKKLLAEALPLLRNAPLTYCLLMGSTGGAWLYFLLSHPALLGETFAALNFGGFPGGLLVTLMITTGWAWLAWIFFAVGKIGRDS